MTTTPIGKDKGSIVIPCYNQGTMLREALASVEKVRNENLIEVIVVDDGSSEADTTQILGEVAELGLVVSIHSTNNVLRGKTGSFVVDMRQSTPSATTYVPYVNFSVSGTAVPGVDYVALVSPTVIGASGCGVILVKTLPNSRGSANRQAYSVVATLEPGAEYAVGAPRSATMWIKPCTSVATCQ